MRITIFIYALLSASSLNAGIIASTLGPETHFSPNGGYLIGDDTFGHGVELAVPFEPYEDQRLFEMRFAALNTSNTTARLVLDLSTGLLPSTPIETFNVTLDPGGPGSVYVVSSILNPLLLAKHTYWLSVSSDDLLHNSFAWSTGSTGEYWQVAERSPGFSLWTLFYLPAPAFEITGTEPSSNDPKPVSIVPEPSTRVLTLLSGVVLVAAMVMGPFFREAPRFRAGDRLLKVAEVCQLLGYSRATVYRLVGFGKLPVVKVAGTIRFRYRSILRWMADHETPCSGSGERGDRQPTA